MFFGGVGVGVAGTSPSDGVSDAVARHGPVANWVRLPGRARHVDRCDMNGFRGNADGNTMNVG